MSPHVWPGAAARSPFATLVLLAPLALAVSNSAAARPALGLRIACRRRSLLPRPPPREPAGYQPVRGQPDLGELHRCPAPRRAPRRRDRGRRAVHERDPLGRRTSAAPISRAPTSRTRTSKEAIFANAILWDATLAGSELKDADFRGAHLLGADLSNVVNGNLADFTGAYFDADTLLDPAIDDSVMYFVVGVCPTNPNQYWIDSDRDGDGDTCHGRGPAARARRRGAARGGRAARGARAADAA